ncbi:hypothetical protein CSC66_04140 [Pseudoxanthomonas kaohsiungensis]|nr:hypothetical protein CSC66_04140 [Pseudoxanthomonas kaohsiungensis]
MANITIQCMDDIYVTWVLGIHLGFAQSVGLQDVVQMVASLGDAVSSAIHLASNGLEAAVLVFGDMETVQAEVTGAGADVHHQSQGVMRAAPAQQGACNAQRFGHAAINEGIVALFRT